MSATDQSRALRQTLDRWPSPAALLVFSLQWLVVAVPGVLVVGDLVAVAWGLDGTGRLAFQQRLFLLMGLTQAAQVVFGHRLPGLVGPASVLLVGVLGSVSSGPGAVYGAMAIGGLVMALLGPTGWASRLGRLYTPPVLASTLMLIAISLVPAMGRMVFDPAAAGRAWGASFLFAMALACLILWAQSRLRGLAGASMLMAGMVVGSAVYYLAGMGPWPGLPPASGQGLTLATFAGPSLGFDLPVVLAFIICSLALVANELGTLESLGRMMDLPDMEKRVGRSVAVGGLGCLAAGLLGVLGPVTYSVSPGVVLATDNASRWSLLPVALALVLLAFWPQGMGFFQLVPQPVAGAVLFCLMALTTYAALAVLEGGACAADRRSGLVVGASLVAGAIISFLPEDARQAMHPYLRPVLGNGFVTGLLLAMILDRLLPQPAAAK